MASYAILLKLTFKATKAISGLITSLVVEWVLETLLL
jgi:hypothetical protein